MISDNTNVIVIAGGTVYDDDGDVHRGQKLDILIVDNSIAETAPDAAPEYLRRYPLATVIDAKAKLIVPGFVNAHFHSYDSFLRGSYEEVPLDLWRVYNARMTAGRSKEEVRLRTLLGATESIRAGITTVQDMSMMSPLSDDEVDVMIDAYRSVGIRVVLSVAVRDISEADTVPFVREIVPPELQKAIGDKAPDAKTVLQFAQSQIERHPAGSRLHWALSPSAPHRCSEGLLRSVGELSRKLDLPVTTHLYESKLNALHARRRYASDGGSLIKHMERAGILNDRLSVAHALWTRQQELETLAEHGVAVVVNSQSNFKIKDGVPRINDFRKANLRLALGCDCTSCCDALNLFEAMKLACLLAAASDLEPTTMSAAEAIRMATLGGARTAGLAGKVGAVKAGMRADLAILDLNDTAFRPLNSIARQLVYSETGRSVETVVIDGKVVMRDRKITTVDEAALVTELAELMPRFRAEFDTVKTSLAPVTEQLTRVIRKARDADLDIDRFFPPRV